MRAIEEQDVTQPRLPLALRPGVHAVGEGALAAAGRGNGPDFVLRLLEQAREHLEAGAAKMLGGVLHDDRVAQVRLVGAVFAHRLGVGNARPRRGRHRLVVCELLEHAADDGLHRRKYVVLLDEAHLDVELIEFAGQTVGARVLVAEAGRDLEIAVEARHHQKLLVLLRGLRQRVKLAGMDARGHEKIAGAFRAGGGQDRGLELEEPLPLHARSKRINDLPAQHDVAMQLLAAQVEKAVAEPRVLGIRLVAENRQRQIARRAEHFDLLHVNLDQPGRHLGVLGAEGAACARGRRCAPRIRSAAFRRP